MQANTPIQQADYDRQKFSKFKTGGTNIDFSSQSSMVGDPRILLYVPTGDLDASVMAYARNISSMLHGSLTQFPQTTVSLPELIEAANHADLIMVHEDLSWWQRWFRASYGRKLAQKLQTSLLVVPAPRWPIRRILFVCRAEANDTEVMPWLIPLAQAVQAEVSVLVIVPSIPAMYRHLSPYVVDAAVILSPNTTSGRLLRSLLQDLKQAGILTKLRLRDGEPDYQIRQETVDGDYDLIITAAEPHGRLLHFLWGELIGPLFGWLDRPLLVARTRAMTEKYP